MDNNTRNYISPEVQALELEVESTILTGSDPMFINPDMDWCD